MTKSGIVQALNVSPKGSCEGVLLKTSKGPIQLNFSKEDRGRWDALQPGAALTAEVEETTPRGKPSHPVFSVVRITKGGQSGKEQKPDGRFSGVIERLNYSLHGEVNGAILDNGNFLHLKPGGARALPLEAGLKVEGKGVRSPQSGAWTVIEADVVNGIHLQRLKAAAKGAKKAAKKAAKKHAGK